MVARLVPCAPRPVASPAAPLHPSGSQWSASEQSTGVAQVDQAMGEIDRGTQQNAALVEQSAAAADSLRRQAESLEQAVAVFRLQAG